MKKVFLMMSLALMAVFVTSCTNDQFDEMDNGTTESVLSSSQNSVMEISSKKDFLSLIENGYSEGTRAGICCEKPSQFISLMDVISPNAEILNELSAEERDIILQNKMTYYEAFGYENIIPNENFAQIVNIDGEIIVQDSLYRISDVATFVSSKEDARELREYLANVDEDVLQDRIMSSPKSRIQLTPRITAVRLVEKISEEDSDCGIGDWAGRSTGSSDSGNNGGSSYSKEDGTGEINLNQIPFSSFPTYSSSSHTFVGKIIDSLFGERHTRHHKFRNGYRVSGSLYDYNYGVYRECGAFVRMDKKRGGVFKLINGWKDIDADKLVLHIDHVVLETKISFSNSVLSKTPTKPVLLGVSNYGNSKQVEIFGRNWSKSDVDRMVGLGAKELFNYLKSELGTDIPNNTRSLVFVTPQKLYKVVYQQTFQANNKHKIREVFSSGCSFVLSINASSWQKSIMSTIQETLKSPSYHIVDGQVKLAGKLNNDWGGMIIYK